MASGILSYNVVQDREGIPIKGYCGLRPPRDLIYSDLSVLITTSKASVAGWLKHASFRRMLSRRRSSNPGDDNVDVATTALPGACASHKNPSK